jgi:hypothetical protein
MNIQNNFLALILLMSVHWTLFSQVNVSGYLTEMPSVTYESLGNNTLVDNLVHNRLNFSWQGNSHFSSSLELRNRFLWGETMERIPGYNEIVAQDFGWADMSWNWASGSNYVVNTFVDRLWIEYVKEQFQVKIGRQRVNWGMSMVWNPNDVFNAYSFFDFDYIERPGLDGVSMQYYTGYSSKLEGVLKVDYKNRLSYAALYRFNKAGYDFQFLSGVYNQDEFVVGGGWTGDIKGAGFYGELTYMRPFDESKNSLIATLGGNYTFRNSLMLQTELLYSSNLKDQDNSFVAFYFLPATVKTLSFTEFTWFVSGSYPVTPLLNTSLAFMGFPSANAWFTGPTIDYSLQDDLVLSVIGQYFAGEVNDRNESNLLGFVRLKWNF